MGTGNWVLDNLLRALEIWSEKLREVMEIITFSPDEFKGGTIWKVVTGIHDGLKGIALGLLTIFFLMGVLKETADFRELKRPEQAFRLFIRFGIGKALVTYSMDILKAIYTVIHGITMRIAENGGGLVTGGVTLPDVIRQKILECGFLESIPLWIVTLLSSLIVTVLSYTVILTVYSRFFTVYMYTAIAPVPLSAFSGEGTRHIGVQFLKSYGAVCLESAVIMTACIIYSAFASSPPANIDPSLSAVQAVWNYMGELIFNLLILTGSVRMSERLIKEMTGL